MKTKLSPLQLAELSKAATDHGFDITPVEESAIDTETLRWPWDKDYTPAKEVVWLCCRSTQFPERVWLAITDDGYLLSSDSKRVLDELAREGLNVDELPSMPTKAIGAVQSTEYGELYQLLSRVAELAKTSPISLVEQFTAATKTLPESTEVERLVKQRAGQDIFRNALIAFWQGRCAVTGLALPSLLRASHIKPWADCANNEERLDVFNGLLLAPHLDALFDGGWVTFDNDGKMVRSTLLDSASIRLLGVTNDMKLAHVAAEHCPYLEFHRQHVFEENVGCITGVFLKQNNILKNRK